MAGKIVAFALVCFILVGMALAQGAPQSSAPAQGALQPGITAQAPEGYNLIGNSEAEAPGDGDNGMAVAGPVGGPIPDGAFPDAGQSTYGEAPAPGKNGAATLQVSAAVGLVAVSSFFFFF
ncbi:hypothetical protein Nepgr_029513 [Nepenthes gracilis]|uniref:Anther-specific protein BCP1-like n=1 Tax=Nepenthes gracilis TaxID=150966 RepID=A0AAD3TDQ5_NEPGR|nr:hypothetical protein Nepgr_029513 [Nepenthes gracilis]